MSFLKHGGHVIALAMVLGGLLLFYSCMRATPVSKTSELGVDTLNAPPLVHIGLSSRQDAQFVPVAVDGSYEITTSDGATVVLEGALLPLTDVSSDSGGVIMGKQRTGADVLDVIPTYDGTLKIGSRYYRGKLRLYRTGGNRVSAVNILDLESYLAGVVGAEMMLAWPAEALKAQAIAARTYALWEMKRTRDASPNRLYDMLDDTSAQCYLGCEKESAKALVVVRETRGAALVFAGKLVPAFYHSTCGGHTSPAYRVGFPVNDTTPLMGVPCGHCKGSKYYNWKHTATGSELAAALRPSAKNRKPVESVSPAETDAGGRIFTVSVRYAGDPKERSMTTRDFRAAVGGAKLKSALFAISRSGSKFEFTGTGWGHGVGLCQYGAFKLSQDGFDYVDILRFYFPGAEVARLYR